MIEDSGLRSLFASESEEHVNALEQGLLQLERELDAGDAELRREQIESVFRAAHSLKGAARMLGLLDIEAFAHHVEDVLSAVRRGNRVLDHSVFEPMLHATDVLRRLSVEALGGARAAVDLASEIKRIEQLTKNGELAALDPIAPEKSVPPPESPPPVSPLAVQAEVPAPRAAAIPAPEPEAPAPVAQSAPAQLPPGEAQKESVATGNETLTEGSLRVPTSLLDNLLNYSGELVVSKTYAVRRTHELLELQQISELLRTALGGEPPAVRALAARLEEGLGRLATAFASDAGRLSQLAEGIGDCSREMSMLPMSALFERYPRMVRDTAHTVGKGVDLEIEGGEIRADKRIIERLRDPLMHMLRNAVVHGAEMPEDRRAANKPEKAKIRLAASLLENQLVIELSDDGRGFDLDGLLLSAVRQRVVAQNVADTLTPAALARLALVSGVSTVPYITELAGRGVGLDVLAKAIEALKGSLEIETTPGKGSLFRLSLPLSLISDRVLLARHDGQFYAFPIEYVVTARRLAPEAFYPVEGRLSVTMGDMMVPISDLGPLLRLNQHAGSASQERSRPCIVLRQGETRFGVLVDSLLDELEIVLKPRSSLLKRIRNVLGFSLLESGDICTLLNPADLYQSLLQLQSSHQSAEEGESGKVRQLVLLVEDSILTRTMEQRILEEAGYDVVTAVDGVDGFNKLANRRFDAVVSDIVMPNLDGLGLTRLIRQDKRYAETPVILVTSLASDEDKRRGVEVGANAYIPKPTFSQKILLDTLARLL